MSKYFPGPNRLRRPEPDLTANRLGDLREVDRSDLVVLHDEWVGYNHLSPVTARYELHRTPRGELIGRGRLKTSRHPECNVDVYVCPADAFVFLDTIANAPVRFGPYEPLFHHTDDYPRLEFTFSFPPRGVGPQRQGGTAFIFSTSQGRYHSPWGASIDGEMWTLPDEAVGRAYAAVRRPLKRALLDRVLRKPDGALVDVAGPARELRYTLVAGQDGDGWRARLKELPECVAQGGSLQQVGERMLEALGAYLDDPEAAKRAVFSEDVGEKGP